MALIRVTPVPENEEDRLEALRAYGIVHTGPEAAFTDLASLASEICEAPIAAVSFVDESRQWFKAALGLYVLETPRDSSFCAHAIAHDGIFSVHDARQDPRFSTNSSVVGDPGIRFYAGAPLVTPAGFKVGTLCVLDTVPRALTGLQRRALRVLAAQVVTRLELRLSKRELARHEADIRARTDSRIRLQRQKQDLVSLVVHDLKNPIAVILPNTGFVLDHARLTEEEREALCDIERSARAMHGMVMNLLDISLSEAGTLSPAWATVRLKDLLEEVRRTARRRAEERGQKLVVSSSLANDCVRADADLLRRVLENLIDNSLKYAAKTKGTIRIEASSTPDGIVDLAVCDNGAGVPAAYRERIFERYAQLDPDTAKHARSSRGLGLTFCRLAVEAHGGTIWAEDRAPTGSAFRMRLPIGLLELRGATANGDPSNDIALRVVRSVAPGGTRDVTSTRPSAMPAQLGHSRGVP